MLAKALKCIAFRHPHWQKIARSGQRRAAVAIAICGSAYLIEFLSTSALRAEPLVRYDGAAAPGQVFELASVAEAALHKGKLPFDVYKTIPRELIETARNATSASIFHFERVDPGPNPTVESTAKSEGKKLSESNLRRLRTLMFSPDSYLQSFDVQKACPFIPSVGFQILAHDQEAWWLVSNDCSAGKLVARTDSWRGQQTINIRAKAVTEFEGLGRL